MTCGCPVITCRNSSLTEVAGDAALFVEEHDANALAACLIALEREELRAGLKKRGLEQAARFDFKAMASIIESTLRDTYEKLRQGRLAGPGEGWRELREMESERSAEKDRTIVSTMSSRRGERFFE